MSIQNKIAAMTARIEAERPPAPRPQEVPPLVRPPRSAGELFIAKVVSDATGGGYYNCYFQDLDATHWETNTSLLQNQAPPVSVVVANLVEVGYNVHNLDAGKYIICWAQTDDEGNRRYVGFELLGRYDFR